MKFFIVKWTVLMYSIIFFNGCIATQLGGAFKNKPEEMSKNMSKEALTLINQTYEGLNSEEIHDFHVHVIGIDSKKGKTWVNPKKLSWAHPVERIRTAVFMSASGVTDFEKVDEQYLDRLVRQIRADKRHGKYHILALDHYYNPDGSINLDHSEFYTSNERVYNLSQKYPDIFRPTISVHPYRVDALQELEKWGKKGVRMIKWLPNAQGMDASNPRCDAYYLVMKKYDMILLTHTGKEAAVDAKETQALGNPLLFRRPLDMGVTVIMAHAASAGMDIDLDDPDKKAVAGFDLFMRMMDNPKYNGLLFGEISAITQFNRLPGPLSQLLARGDIHHRLVNGSDYPMPALNIIVNTGKLVKYGFINDQEQALLNEIYDFNPLLFDFIVKRTVRLPGTQKRFHPSVFTIPAELAVLTGE